MVVEPHNKLHLVVSRVANDNAGGEDVQTACGQQLWSDVEAPPAEGMRGSWQAREVYEVHPCAACADHSGGFPEALEKPGDENLATGGCTKTPRERVGARSRDAQ